MWRRILWWTGLGFLTGWLGLAPPSKSGETGEARGGIDPNGLTLGPEDHDDKGGGIDPNGLSQPSEADEDARGDIDPNG